MARSPSELKSCLKGIVGFGVTPFNPDLSINCDALRQNTAHLVEHCDVVVALGNNGEIFSLSPEEQKQVARTAFSFSRRTIPARVTMASSSITALWQR